MKREKLTEKGTLTIEQRSPASDRVGLQWEVVLRRRDGGIAVASGATKFAALRALLIGERTIERRDQEKLQKEKTS